nr:hypothetical protein CFP56_33475 [Quercus suber]
MKPRMGRLPQVPAKSLHLESMQPRALTQREVKQSRLRLRTAVKQASSASCPLLRSPSFALGLLARSSTRPFHKGQVLDKWNPAVGAEPGIDRDTQTLSSYIGRSSECEIKIIDYSAQKIVQHAPTSGSLSEYLESHTRPEWAACRWIYVNGLDLDVIKALANSKTLHRLAVEDVVHASSPTKVDWYNDHAYIVMTLQNLIKRGQCGDESDRQKGASPSMHFPQDSNFSRVEGAARHNKVWPSTHPDFAVSAEQVSVFLTADKTVITIFEHSGQEVLTPILALLESVKTIVRSSDDPAMLVHAVIDTVVDLYLPIAKAFAAEFQDLEQAVLIAPTIAQSRMLYALRSELTRLRDNIVPIGSVIGMLRDHCAVAHPEEVSPAPGSPVPRPSSFQPMQNAMPESASLVSPLARTYLADVQDHVRVLESGTRASIRSAENLTSLIFNTVTAKQNESVRQLTLVSIFFLPLTFLTGKFFS